MQIGVFVIVFFFFEKIKTHNTNTNTDTYTGSRLNSYILDILIKAFKIEVNVTAPKKKQQTNKRERIKNVH